MINASSFKITIFLRGRILIFTKNLLNFIQKKIYKKFISGNFDTTIGMKQEAQSYENILKALNKTSDQALFLTDMLRGNF